MSNSPLYYNVFKAPFGPLTVIFDDTQLHKISFNFIHPMTLPQLPQRHSSLFELIFEQLQQYFNHHPNYIFTLPLKLQGTIFQQRVWQALGDITTGTTQSYGALATQLHSAPRAIGQACKTNPFPIIIPCHRVIAKQGLGGFSGNTADTWLNIKRWLLRHERALS